MIDGGEGVDGLEGLDGLGGLEGWRDEWGAGWARGLARWILKKENALNNGEWA